MKKISLVLFITIFLWTCSSPNNPSMIKSFILGDTITIHYQETIYNLEENSWIKFNSVVEDSRCPIGAQCWWEGNAKISFKIKKNFYSSNFDLNTYRNFIRDTVLFGYSISLIEVMPYPDLDSLYSQSDYSAKLIISK